MYLWMSSSTDSFPAFSSNKMLDSRELLRRRSDVEHRLRRNRHVLLDVRQPVSLLINNLSAAINSQRAPRRSRRRQILKHLIDRRLQLLLDCRCFSQRPAPACRRSCAIAAHVTNRKVPLATRTATRRSSRPHTLASQEFMSPSPESPAECIRNAARPSMLHRIGIARPPTDPAKISPCSPPSLAP